MTRLRPPDSPDARPARRRALPEAIPFIALLPLLFVLDRPVMIDDTLFLKAAGQILRDPLRPFAFVVNWYGWDEPFWHVFKNPPGLSYWLAAVEALAGPSERAWHVSLLPFAVLATVAGVALARRFAAGSPWATAAWVASPAFLVSAATLMADVPSLALSLSGLGLWVRGIDGDARRARLAGAALVGLAVVVKYTAVLGVATLALYGLIVASDERRRRGLADLWTAALAPAVWSVLTLATDGRNHLVDALAVGGGGFDPNPGWLPHRAVATLTFIAGTSVSAAIVAPAALTRRRGVMTAGGAVVTGLLAAGITPWVWSPRGLRPGAIPLVAALAALGALALAVAVSRALDRAGRDDRFLAAWVVLHLAYLLLWCWTIAGRFVLPVLPPLALLLARALTDGKRSPRRDAVLATGALVALAVSVAVLFADRDAGTVAPRAVAEIAARASADRAPGHFVGAWGFAYYAERAGLTKVDSTGGEVGRGALVLQPYYAANRDIAPALAERLEEVASLPGPRPTLGIHTMNLNVGAGFYSSAYGPLPFFPAALPAEGVIVWRVKD